MSSFPAICFVGALVGKNSGFIPTQAEQLAKYFIREGLPVRCVSHRIGRFGRLREIVTTLVKERRKIDVQCVQVYSGPGFIVADVASALGTVLGHRIVMTLRGGGLPQFAARHPRWVRRVLRRAHAVTAPSAFLVREMSHMGSHIHVIPNVIDLGRYPFRRRVAAAPRLLWMRAFHRIYNPQLAIRTLARVQLELPNATLVMAGPDKGELAATQSLADELGVRDAVRFAGFLDFNGKLAEGQAADIFLSTNRVDNMPVSIVEACAFGLLVVAAKVGGIPDLLTHEQDALLVPDDDDEAMAAAVLRLVRTPDLAVRLSSSGRLLAERSEWDRVFSLWRQLFLGLETLPRRS